MVQALISLSKVARVDTFLETFFALVDNVIDYGTSRNCAIIRNPP
jgi:hypothetical protein